jgi:hypothetical protein
MKKFTVTITAMLAAVLLAGLSVSAQNAPVDVMLIEAPNPDKARKAPVEFSHQAHKDVEKDCLACHHKWDETGDPPPCTECHDNMDDKRSEDSFYMAFHNRRSAISCVGCHGALKKAGKGAGPTKCSDCHPRVKR